MTELFNKNLQIAAFALGAGFLVFSVGYGEARYYGLDASLFESFAASNPVTNPKSLEIVPVGSANLSELKKGDVFQVLTDKTSFTLAVKYNYTPPGEPTQYLESNDWAAQDANGVSLHQITEYSPTGRYQITEFKDNQATDWVWLGQAGPTVTVGYFPEAAAEGINLEIKALGKADLTKLKPGDQYSARATKVSDSSPLSNTTLDVKYVGPDTNGQEKLVEQWARLDGNGVAVINITSAVKPGDYILTTVRIHKEPYDSNSFAAPANYVPRLTIVAPSVPYDIASVVQVFQYVPFESLSDREKVEILIIEKITGLQERQIAVGQFEKRFAVSKSRVLGENTGQDTVYAGRGMFLTNNPQDLFFQMAKILDPNVNTSKLPADMGGFAISNVNFPKFLSALNSGNVQAGDWSILGYLTDEKILNYNSNRSEPWSNGKNGEYGFGFTSLELQDHERIHLADGFDNSSKTKLINSWNKLSLQDQLSFFLTLIHLGYVSTIDNFSQLSEWHAYSTYPGIIKFFEIFAEIKEDFNSGLASVLSGYALDLNSDDIAEILSVKINSDGKTIHVELFDDEGKLIFISDLKAKDFADFVRSIIIFLFDSGKVSQETLREKMLETLSAKVRASFTGTRLLKDEKIVYLQNNVPQNVKTYDSNNAFASYANVFPRDPTQNPIRVQVRVTYNSVQIALSNGIIYYRDSASGQVISSQGPEDILGKIGFVVPSDIVFESGNFSKGSLDSMLYTSNAGGTYEVTFFKDGNPTGYGLYKPSAETREGDPVAAYSADGKKYVGILSGDDGSTVKILLSSGSVLIWKNGSGKMECSAQRDCQLYDGGGRATWHIDSNGYVTNPGNGWNGRNPFDASQAQIIPGFYGSWKEGTAGIICANGCGPVSGWVQGNDGGWHNGGYFWPDGSWSPAKGRTGPPKKNKYVPDDDDIPEVLSQELVSVKVTSNKDLQKLTTGDKYKIQALGTLGPLAWAKIQADWQIPGNKALRELYNLDQNSEVQFEVSSATTRGEYLLKTVTHEGKTVNVNQKLTVIADQSSTSVSSPVPLPQTSPVPPPSAYTIVIQAKGTLASGVYPTMQLRLGESVVLASWIVDGTFRDYTFATPGTLNSNNLRVYFTNDYYKPPEDRNLIVDYISVNSRIYQSEDPGVYSYGSWSFLTRCAGGYKKTETLHCQNAYFEYPTK